MKIKICGLKSQRDVQYVNEAAPDYCGFVIDYPKSFRSVAPERAAELSSLLSENIIPVGVFVNERIETVARLLNGGAIRVAQLHGDEDGEYIERLRSIAGGEIWQAFVVKDGNDVKRARESKADLILLDAGRGSGRGFDLSLIKDICRPFALAGGLNAQNLSVAKEVGAVIADISGGAETDGAKDIEKIKQIVRAARALR